MRSYVFPTALLVGLVVALLASNHSVLAQEDTPATVPAHQLEITYVGDVPYQMYVERRTPLGIPTHLNALIFVHGNGVTGTMWDHTPDNREGWATYFLRQGITTYVVDLPGHGRSPMPPDFATMGLDEAVSAVQSSVLRAGPSILVGHSLEARPTRGC
jgi:pimeloyl-ACP methyl ester carboxylesterase